MVHGVNGTAEIFFQQLMTLCPKGYRILSVQYPAYSSHECWIKAFDKFIDTLKVPKIHLFGASLGGYLTQLYVHYKPSRILSLILCNTYCDNQYYVNNCPFAGLLSWTPEFVIKRMLLQNIPDFAVDGEIANSIDFMVELSEAVHTEELVSRLLLKYTAGPVVAPELQIDQTKITIIDCLDDTLHPERVRDEVYKLFPNARQALLKTGGNFPYLSRPDEVNLHIEIHLRNLNYERVEDGSDFSHQKHEQSTVEQKGSEKEH